MNLDLRIARGPSGEMDVVQNSTNLYIPFPGPKSAKVMVDAVEACKRVLAAERGEGGFYAAVVKAREALGVEHDTNH
jgi:hypothetical protein